MRGASAERWGFECHAWVARDEKGCAVREFRDTDKDYAELTAAAGGPCDAPLCVLGGSAAPCDAPCVFWEGEQALAMPCATALFATGHLLPDGETCTAAAPPRLLVVRELKEREVDKSKLVEYDLTLQTGETLEGKEGHPL